jgi:hypothetical protein
MREGALRLLLFVALVKAFVGLHDAVRCVD